MGCCRLSSSWRSKIAFINGEQETIRTIVDRHKIESEQLWSATDKKIGRFIQLDNTLNETAEASGS